MMAIRIGPYDHIFNVLQGREFTDSSKNHICCIFKYFATRHIDVLFLYAVGNLRNGQFLLNKCSRISFNPYFRIAPADLIDRTNALYGFNTRFQIVGIFPQPGFRHISAYCHVYNIITRCYYLYFRPFRAGRQISDAIRLA